MIYSHPVEVRHKLPALKSLTPIRFLAAMYVVVFHESHGPGHIVLFPLASRFVESGYTAVTLFFVLSGFILAYNYERIRSYGEFWVSRFARIYPIYFLSLLPAFITPHWSHHPRPGAVGLILTFSLLQSWWIPLAPSLNAAAWTLSVEAFFYAAFPFLLPWIQGLRRRTFIGIQAGYLLLLCVPPLLSLFPATGPAGSQLAGWLESPFPLVRLNAFVLGVYAGVEFRRSMHREGATPMNSRTDWRLLPAALAPLTILCIAPAWLYWPLRTGLLQLSYAFFIPLLARVRWPFLSNYWVQMAGEISYGVYVLQFLSYFSTTTSFTV
jgi:peptidoglycan/LPS O-acetylase OafA/YrhL